MAVGRRLVRLIERAHAHEGHQRARACEVAPDRRMTMRAARDLLTQTAAGRGANRAGPQVQPLGFDQGVKANDALLSRWHPRQWQQCTKSGALAIR
jgi:hypothetical protein